MLLGGNFVAWSGPQLALQHRLRSADNRGQSHPLSFCAASSLILVTCDKVVTAARPAGSSGAVTPSPAGGDLSAEVAAAKAKLQRAKRTLDAMKKREAEAVAAKEASETRLAAALQEREQQVPLKRAVVQGIRDRNNNKLPFLARAARVIKLDAPLFG